MIVGIQDEILKIQALGFLERLLADKTTKTNILWSTDVHKELGKEYERDQEIHARLITGRNSGVIKNRARKALEIQTERTRQHAEVFTPHWVCKEMNDTAETSWFPKKNLCPFDGGEKINFLRNKKWQLYVDARRIEITCGEAPYLVSRYDALTGESIPIKERTGLLDRKLRVVNENTDTEEDWLKWTFRAFQSIYGYEFQGDNLLIARVNILMTFEEYLQERWKRKPTFEEYRTIINIITWNIWQMDGLTGSIPYSKNPEENHQMSLFDYLDEEENRIEQQTSNQPHCRVFDWRRDNSIEFLKINEGGKKRMKFDFVIGNPPYQEETTQKEILTNGQTPKKNIFHYFQMQADEIAEKATALIYPAGRWIHRSGKGMADFGLKQINDPHLKEIILYSDARDVFSGVAIADGISIVVKDMKKTESGFKYIFIKDGKQMEVDMANPGEDLMPLDPRDISVLSKVGKFVDNYHIDYLHNHILPRSLFGIESDFVFKHPEAVRPLEGNVVDSNYEIKLFTNDKAGKAGRAKWFITSKSVINSNKEYIEEWQVVVSSANAGGQKRDNQLEIIDNHSAFGRARVALRSFKTQVEAQNFYKYVKSYIIRYTFLMTDEALSSLGKRVPDILNYTSENGIIDFSKDVDKQLYDLIDLDAEEIQYIQKRVDSVRRK